MTATAPLVTWQDSYSVRVLKIDAQHKILIDLINQLNAAMKTGKAQEAMSGILDQLIGYAGTHFASEEKFMAERRYSGLIAHRQQHGFFAEQVCELRGKFRAGRLTISIDTLKFLKDWLINHILSSDQAYARELSA